MIIYEYNFLPNKHTSQKWPLLALPFFLTPPHSDPGPSSSPPAGFSQTPTERCGERKREAERGAKERFQYIQYYIDRAIYI